MLSGEYFYPILSNNTKKARFQEGLELPESRKDGFDDRFEQQYPSKVVSHKNTFRYVRFGLSTNTLVPETQKLLEMLGVECLEEGGPGEAYGIIVANEHALVFLERVTGVIDATLQDPPCSK